MGQQIGTQPFSFGADLFEQRRDLFQEGPVKSASALGVLNGMGRDLVVGQLGEFGAEQVSGGAAAGQIDLVAGLEEASDQGDAAGGMAESPVERGH